MVSMALPLPLAVSAGDRGAGLFELLQGEIMDRDTKITVFMITVIVALATFIIGAIIYGVSRLF